MVRRRVGGRRGPTIRESGISSGMPALVRAEIMLEVQDLVDRGSPALGTEEAAEAKLAVDSVSDMVVVRWERPRSMWWDDECVVEIDSNVIVDND